MTLDISVAYVIGCLVGNLAFAYFFGVKSSYFGLVGALFIGILVPGL